MTRDQAKDIALKYLNSDRSSDDLVDIIDEQTIEETFGWVFFYESKKFLETGEEKWMLAGNSPLIVDQDDGSVHSTGAGPFYEQGIEEYKRSKVET